MDDGSEYHCLCPPGYTGLRCTEAVTEVQPNACQSQPCYNDGNCRPIDGGEGFECQCTTDWQGEFCETPCNEQCEGSSGWFFEGSWYSFVTGFWQDLRSSFRLGTPPAGIWGATLRLMPVRRCARQASAVLLTAWRQVLIYNKKQFSDSINRRQMPRALMIADCPENPRATFRLSVSMRLASSLDASVGIILEDSPGRTLVILLPVGQSGPVQVSRKDFCPQHDRDFGHTQLAELFSDRPPLESAGTIELPSKEWFVVRVDVSDTMVLRESKFRPLSDRIVTDCCGVTRHQWGDYVPT